MLLIAILVELAFFFPVLVFSYGCLLLFAGARGNGVGLLSGIQQWLPAVSSEGPFQTSKLTQLATLWAEDLG